MTPEEAQAERHRIERQVDEVRALQMKEISAYRAWEQARGLVGRLREQLKLAVEAEAQAAALLRERATAVSELRERLGTRIQLLRKSEGEDAGDQGAKDAG